ncbi:MAG: hypothetical protein Q4G11_06205, partial [Gallicola sp.]|nr:hypothetical protein [Gallicola sp.]
TKLKDKKDSNNLVEEIKNNTRGGAGGGNPRETVDVEETSSSTLEPFEDFEMKGKRDLKGKNSQKRKQQSTSQSKDPEIAPKENAGEPQMPKTYKHTTESEKLATGENKGQKIDYWKIANEWNEKTKGVMGEIRTLSEKRKTSIRARIRETSEEDFMTMIQLAAQSDFLKGENQRNWTATFDWCIKPTNYEKILSLNFNKQQRKKEEKEKKTDYLEYKSIVDYEQKNGKI